MPMFDLKCQSCGTERRDVWARVAERDSLSCCGARMDTIYATAHAVRGDEIDETHHDLDPAGGVIRFRSRQEKQRYLDAHGLQPFVRYGGPQDQHVKPCGMMDPQTMANAEALVARMGTATADIEVRCESFASSIRVVDLAEMVS